jgi:hypothetical protein
MIAVTSRVVDLYHGAVMVSNLHHADPRCSLPVQKSRSASPIMVDAPNPIYSQ